MRTAHPLALRLRKFIQENELLSRRERVAVGFSGGPDSTCLLHLLLQLGYKVIALHLNHGQRPEADEEERLCALRAKKWGAEFVSEKCNVPDFAKKHGIGLEEAGRILRYQFFEKVSAQRGGIKVATAHTLDDTVETILINLARGTGMGGLAGIPLRRGIIIRPLLWARRQETQEYCREHALPTFSDPSNLSLAFTRVRVRKRFIPLWETIHPRAVENTARTAKILAEENQLLNKLAVELLLQSEKFPKVLSWIAQKIERRFLAEKLRGGDPALIRRAFLLALKSFTLDPSLSPDMPHPFPNFELLDAATKTLLAREQTAFTLPGGEVVMEIFPYQIKLRSLKPVIPFEKELGIPGVVTSPERLWEIRAGRTLRPPSRDPSGCETATIPLAHLRGGLIVRACTGKDRIHLQKEGEVIPLKKWQERGLPASVRARVPVVCDEMGVIWAPGVGVTQRRATRKKQGWLVLTIEGATRKPMV